MIDHGAAYLALRARAKAVTVATTGAVDQTATATGYARAAGSYITDGFRVGHEITSVSGFATSGNNQATSAQGRVITAVTATALACSGTTVESTPATVTITVGIPYKRALENEKLQPVQGFPYCIDQYVPATYDVVTMPAANGSARETGLYVVTLYGLADTGPLGIAKYVQEIQELFTPGTQIVTSASDTLRIPVQGGPQRGQIIPQENGWARCTVRIPWWAESTNLVAA